MSKSGEVRDEQGRRRFHGAFTGGFSAGYFNTVGSAEGWQPSTFSSSRSRRAKVSQNPMDYMDDEDYAQRASGEEEEEVEERPQERFAYANDQDEEVVYTTGKTQEEDEDADTITFRSRQRSTRPKKRSAVSFADALKDPEGDDSHSSKLGLSSLDEDEVDVYGGSSMSDFYTSLGGFKSQRKRLKAESSQKQQIQGFTKSVRPVYRKPKLPDDHQPTVVDVQETPYTLADDDSTYTKRNYIQHAVGDDTFRSKIAASISKRFTTSGQTQEPPSPVDKKQVYRTTDQWLPHSLLSKRFHVRSAALATNKDDNVRRTDLFEQELVPHLVEYASSRQTERKPHVTYHTPNKTY